MTRPVTLFTGQLADLPLRGGLPAGRRAGATTASRSPAGATTSTSARRRATTATSQGRREILERHGLKVWAISNHLTGQAVCDDPIDQRHRGILPAAVWGDGDAGGRAAAGRRGDEDDRARRREARRRHRRRLHRLVDLEVRRDVPAGRRRR